VNRPVHSKAAETAAARRRRNRGMGENLRSDCGQT
jgi:hypothetical protein